VAEIEQTQKAALMSFMAIDILLSIVLVLLIACLISQRRGRYRAESTSQAILKAIPDVMFLISADGVYLDFHAGDKSGLYAVPEKFLGKTVREVMPPNLADAFSELFEKARITMEPQLIEYSLPVNGETRTYEARIVARDDNKIVSIVRDNTELRRTERSVTAQAAALKTSAEHVRDLAGRLIASQEAERARIARDLHDDLGQKLALLSIELDHLPVGPQQTGEELARIRELKTLVKEMSHDAHQLSYELHPSKLATLGLVAAIGSCCRDLARQHDVTIAFKHTDVPSTIEPDTALCLYRVVQEALHNIVKHSGASGAEVLLKGNGAQIDLQIADSGRGFLPESQSSGLGLLSMRERVHFVGGRFVVRASPGNGTRIGVRIPLRAKHIQRSGQQIA
jgi:signal transduction histidine kinase